MRRESRPAGADIEADIAGLGFRVVGLSLSVDPPGRLPMVEEGGLEGEGDLGGLGDRSGTSQEGSWTSL